jgi:hypothetical protein
MSQTVEDLIAEYRSTAAAWDVLQSDAKKANPLFDRIHAIYKQLRTEQPGRDAIAALMDDPATGVRLMAAGHSLAWAPDKAVKVLEAIQAEPGLHAVSAKYTLKSFREGKLDMDW